MFKFQLAAAALAALVLGASVVATEAAETKSASLSGDALRKAVSGKTVFLKISGFELPIRYAASGTMVGSMGTVMASLARGDGATDRGKWWITDNQLCQRWSSWMNAKSYCYKFTVKGSAVQWVRNDGVSGTARIGS
ncbi:MAG: hypothetical protein ACOYB4_11490 [Methyloceanibacter sp.]